MTPDTLKTYVSYQCSKFKTHKSDTKDKFSNTRFIEWYHNKNSSGLYLLTYNLPKVLPYTPSVIIHHNKRVSVSYCPPSEWGNEVS
jgi:hypothetical protein